MIMGVTGGIASGKSTVAKAFGELGVPWVDADDVAREVVEPGEPALSDITERYGKGVLLEDGRLNRRALRAIVFAEPEERRWLESVTHPRIRERLLTHLARLQAEGAPYVLLVSPLLLESGQAALCGRILVIDVPEAVQIQRTLARDGVDEAQARAIIAAQMPREARLALADEVIDNSGDQRRLADQVAEIDQRLRAMTSSPGHHKDTHE